EEGLETVNGRLDRLEERLETVNGRLDRLEEGLETVNGRLDRLEEGLETVNGRLETIDGRLETIDGRLDSLDSRVAGLEYAQYEHHEYIKDLRSGQRKQEAAIIRLEGTVQDVKLETQEIKQKQDAMIKKLDAVFTQTMVLTEEQTEIKLRLMSLETA
ncbi:MAG: hypothetical protein FWH33_11475, partial [Oscillospiraceae bacterium]|nr:hypothetical protein [Oscillospiraceae bacterium]